MYRYQLEKSSKKHVCPACGQKRFVRIVDVETGEMCPDHFGRCDREQSCGYINLYTHHHTQDATQPKPISWHSKRLYKEQESKKPHYIDEQLFSNSLQHTKNTTLFQHLITRYDKELVTSAFTKYCVGANPYKTTQTAFWQVDQQGNKRTAELISYLPNGKRDKSVSHNWIHAKLISKGIIKDFNLCQCAYGVHLLKPHTTTRVAVVEGAKTALILSMIYPQYVWIGTTGVYGLNQELVNLLNPSITILVPDAGYEAKWKQRSGGKYQIMRIDHFVAPGDDLADVL
jgi:hypothetical protein